MQKYYDTEKYKRTAAADRKHAAEKAKEAKTPKKDEPNSDS